MLHLNLKLLEQSTCVNELFWAAISALIGAFIAFIFWFVIKRPEEIEQKAELEKITARLDEANRKLNEDENTQQKKLGFVPITVGLKSFEDRICQRMSTANKSVKLCLSTPLIYSLKAHPWRTYSRKSLNQNYSDYWPNDFCEEFRKILIKHRNTYQERLEVELIFLDERSIKNLLQELNPSVPYAEYSESLNFFIDEVLRNDEKAGETLCKLDVHRVMKIPFYLALFDVEEEKNSRGIVAFANDRTLLHEHKSNKTTQDLNGTRNLAENLQSYEFTNPAVVRFMNQLFDQTKLLSDQQLTSFLEICITNGFSWSAIAHGVSGDGKELKPHATLLHTTGSIDTKL
ncbi:hypothetical protein [Nitrosomonas sp.]|uniref:hypothetical protein n=1 Tax=Nitrosomonas sp. TaxID=42353 RepID=UPI0025E3A7E3|nr:hypothetical protein [Nitrosomonas sp.]